MQDNDEAEPIEERIEAIRRQGRTLKASDIEPLIPLITEMVFRILKEEGRLKEGDAPNLQSPAFPKGNSFRD